MPKANEPQKKSSSTGKTSKAGTKKTTTKAQQAVASAEKKVNKAVSNVSKKIEQKVSPEFREKATRFASQADKFATEVESVGEELEHITESILPAGVGSSASFTASYDEKVSRLFIFRCLRLVIEGPIIAIRSVRYAIISIIHVLYMFFAGQRNKDLRKRQMRFRRHVISRKAYMNALVDHRPELIVE